MGTNGLDSQQSLHDLATATSRFDKAMDDWESDMSNSGFTRALMNAIKDMKLVMTKAKLDSEEDNNFLLQLAERFDRASAEAEELNLLGPISVLSLQTDLYIQIQNKGTEGYEIYKVMDFGGMSFEEFDCYSEEPGRLEVFTKLHHEKQMERLKLVLEKPVGSTSVSQPGTSVNENNGNRKYWNRYEQDTGASCNNYQPCSDQNTNTAHSQVLNYAGAKDNVTHDSRNTVPTTGSSTTTYGSGKKESTGTRNQVEMTRIPVDNLYSDKMPYTRKFIPPRIQKQQQRSRACDYDHDWRHGFSRFP